MQITPTNNTMSFKKFYMPKTLYEDGYKLVKKELPELQKLGEKYDINLISQYSWLLDTEYLIAFAKPLNKNLTFWQELFGNKGIKIADTQKCSSAVDLVQRAIAILNKNS